MPLLNAKRAIRHHFPALIAKTGLVHLYSRFGDTYLSPQKVHVPLFRPFDYGRFEFRFDREGGEVRFLEVNLNANLWSQKVYGRSAKLAGFSQEQLIETILAEGLRRHGLF
jgi:hypothetical protein